MLAWTWSLADCMYPDGRVSLPGGRGSGDTLGSTLEALDSSDIRNPLPDGIRVLPDSVADATVWLPDGTGSVTDACDSFLAGIGISNAGSCSSIGSLSGRDSGMSRG